MPSAVSPRPVTEVDAVLANMVESALTARPAAAGDERAASPATTTTSMSARSTSSSAVGVSKKIGRRHLDRVAVVYVRQSTLAQVREHVESTARQYAPTEPISGWCNGHYPGARQHG
jgi:hypothetical protein